MGVQFEDMTDAEALDAIAQFVEGFQETLYDDTASDELVNGMAIGSMGAIAAFVIRSGRLSKLREETEQDDELNALADKLRDGDIDLEEAVEALGQIRLGGDDA